MLSRLAKVILPLLVLAAIAVATIGALCTVPAICLPPITIG